MHGLVDEGMDIVRATRQRHDGSRRNPWSDIECGSYYARSMSAWQLVNAFSGLQADFVAGRLTFAPKVAGDSVLFWSAGTAIGTLTVRNGKMAIEVAGGTLDVAEILVGSHAMRLPTRQKFTVGSVIDLPVA
jgi:hypothetical protein